MTNEEMGRAIEFAVKQQAQLGTDLQKLEQNLGTLERNVDTAVNLLSELTKTQLRMAEAQIQTDNSMAELAKAQKRTDEALAETNDRLNSLIVVVERYFSNGRQGK